MNYSTTYYVLLLIILRSIIIIIIIIIIITTGARSRKRNPKDQKWLTTLESFTTAINVFFASYDWTGTRVQPFIYIFYSWHTWGRLRPPPPPPHWFVGWCGRCAGNDPLRGKSPAAVSAEPAPAVQSIWIRHFPWMFRECYKYLTFPKMSLNFPECSVNVPWIL
jgi:hypothetical protein